MNSKVLRSIAAQVLDGRKLHDIDFGEPGLKLEEKLSAIDQALKRFPDTSSGPVGQERSDRA